MTVAIRTGLVAIVALLAGCAPAPKTHPPQLVVVLPDGEGKVGTVVVTGEEGSTTLNKPYAAARVESIGGKSEARSVSEGEVKKVFAEAVAAQPLRPVSFFLYFQVDTDEYTPESKQAFDSVFTEIARRKAAEIAVIGHTDRVGALEYNDGLSLKRAERVRNDFVERGIPTTSISVAGRGEREPLVPTADEVSEPRNRRVEISVR